MKFADFSAKNEFIPRHIGPSDSDIHEMLKTFQDNPFCGTVGARLHYEDNTVQHNGIFIFLDNKDKIKKK